MGYQSFYSQFDYTSIISVIPIIGDASDPSPWISIVAEIDTVIDAVATADLKGIGASLLSAVSEAAQKYRPAGAAKL